MSFRISEECQEIAIDVGADQHTTKVFSDDGWLPGSDTV